MSALHMPAPHDIEPPFGASPVRVAAPASTGAAVTADLAFSFAAAFVGWSGVGGAAVGAAVGEGEGRLGGVAATGEGSAAAEAAAPGAEGSAAGAAGAAAAAAAGGSGVAWSALLQPADALAPRTARAATNVSKVSDGMRIR
jgi:hypothetical protein